MMFWLNTWLNGWTEYMKTKTKKQRNVVWSLRPYLPNVCKWHLTYLTKENNKQQQQEKPNQDRCCWNASRSDVCRRNTFLVIVRCPLAPCASHSLWRSNPLYHWLAYPLRSLARVPWLCSCSSACPLPTLWGTLRWSPSSTLFILPVCTNTWTWGSTPLLSAFWELW